VRGEVSRERAGALLCLLAAAAYSSTAIFAKVAYAAGVDVATLLALRYLIAAPLFWLLVAGAPAAGLAAGGPVRLPGRLVARGLVLGLVGTSAQVWLFASALARIDAALASLLLYSYPAMVALGAVLIGRERANRRRVAALVVATAGVALVLAGGGDAARDGLGIAFGLGAALTYTITLLMGHALLRQIPPLHLAALSCTGAAVTFAGAGLLGGLLHPGFGPGGWAAVAGIALLATVVAPAASLAGVARIGPTVASILTTTEVPLTVVCAVLLLGERLRPSQFAGGLLVLAAVLLLQLRRAALPALPFRRSAPERERGADEPAARERARRAASGDGSEA